MSLESFPISHKSLDSDPERNEKRDVREFAFTTSVSSKLIENFEELLENAELSEEEIGGIEESLAQLTTEEILAFLSVPYELQPRRVEIIKERLRAGKSHDEIVKEIAQSATKAGYTIGYHVSNNDIQPGVDDQTGRDFWYIDGREPDHRDGDLTMAYYSLDLAHLYGKKQARYIYAVRGQQGDETTHRKDNNGKWGRAGKLDIITRFEYDDLMREVDVLAKQLQEPTPMRKAA